MQDAASNKPFGFSVLLLCTFLILAAAVVAILASRQKAIEMDVGAVEAAAEQERLLEQMLASEEL